MDLLTWTRKGKDSNIYYIYTHIYILIGMLPKSQSLESLLVLFCYCYCYCYYLLLLLLLSLCVCVCYPCKQFVVVTIRRTGSWNTIPYLTLPYLTHLFLSDSDKIYRDSSSIHRLVSRKNDYSGRQTRPPSEQISNLPENSLESITVQIQFSKYSRRALGRHSLWWWLFVIIRKAEAKPNRIYQSSRRKFTFFLRSTTCLSCTNTDQYQEEEEEKEEEEEDPKNNNNNNIKTMTHHRMGFTPSTSSSSSTTTTTNPSATTTKKPPQRACLGGMVITPCEKCTIRTYVSLSLLSHPIHHHFYPYPYPIPLPSSSLSFFRLYRIPRP